jgi:hypothetical protein
MWNELLQTERILFMELLWGFRLWVGDFMRRKFSDWRKRLQMHCRTSMERTQPEYKEIGRHLKIFEMTGGVEDLVELVRFLR